MMTEENGDLISRLPNEILQQIISMFSLKEAVQISTLSTSWRSLMSPNRVNSAKQEVKQIFESMANAGGGFQTLKLHLDSSDVAFALCTKGVNGELHLDFSQHYKQQLLPFQCNKTTFGLIVKQITSSLSLPTFSHIKSLHLRSISHLSGETVADLWSSWSFLECLKLEKCDGLESIEVESSDSLKHFEVCDCPNIVRVSVSARNLNSFSYKGVFTVLELLNVPTLVKVALDFRDGLGANTFDCEDYLSLLSSVKDIETLQLTSCLIEALCCGGVIFSKLEFQFSRLKDLKLICSEISGKTRDSFACFLHMTPSLEELELKIEQGWRCIEYPLSYQNWHEPHLWKDYATVKCEACQLKHLKKIKIKGFTMENDQLLLMDLLLHNGINLKEMILDDCWRVARVPYSHLKYIKLKYLVIPCPDIHSHFVLIQDSTTPKL